MRKQLLALTMIARAAAVAATANVADSAEKTTLGGRACIELSRISQDSNGKNTDATRTGLDVKRFHLILDHVFDPMWAANLTTDYNYSTTTSETQVYIWSAHPSIRPS